MSYRKFQIYFYLVIFAISLALTVSLFWSYLTLLAFGGVLAIISRPLYRFFLRVFRRESIAAFLTVLLMLIVVIVPLAYFLIALSTDLLAILPDLKSFIGRASITEFLQQRLPSAWQAQVPALLNEAVQLARTTAQGLSDNVFGLFTNIAGMLFGFLVVFMATYYLLKDAVHIKNFLFEISPLGDEYDKLILHRIIVAVRAVMGGVLIIAVIKGVVSGAVFYLFGIPTPMLWGALTGIVSFVPIVGSAIVIIPMLFFLLLQGQFVTALIFALVMVVSVGLVDNVLQPKLVESKTKIHPLFILLSVLGGLELYGFAGFILGPLTLAVTVALIEIYKKEIKKFL